MGENNTMIEIQYATSKTGNKRVPIEINILEGDELLFSSAIYASDKIYNIPQSMQDACKLAPGITYVRQQLSSLGVPVMV